MKKIWQKAGLGSWGLCLLASLGLHGLLLGIALQFPQDLPKPKKVVAVEAVCLVHQPGPQGGRSGGAEAATPSPPAPRPAPKPAPPPPKIKPPPPKPKPVRKVAPAPEPEPVPIPPKLAMPRPAPAPAPASRPPVTVSSGQAAGSLRGPASGAGGAGGGTGRGAGPGAGAGRGLGSGQGLGSGTSNILAAYLATVRSLLEKHKRYPGEARRQWQQGVVVLSFTIGSNGEIAHSKVARSSGHQSLDEAARETLTRLSRFPPLPPQLNRSHLAIEVPLAFRLREG